jgi:hypothetical protein
MKDNLVVFESSDETLVCSATNKDAFIAEWFGNKSDRDIEDYDVSEVMSVRITSTLRVRTDR